MDPIVRAVTIYIVLMVIFRVAGKRALAQTTTFDFVLPLIVSEVTQQAMVGDDFSITAATLAITTLIGLDIGLSILKQKLPFLDKWMDDVPLVIVDDGKVLHDRLTKTRIDESDILHAARELLGLERMDKVKYAVLERGGGISIIPRQTGG